MRLQLLWLGPLLLLHPMFGAEKMLDNFSAETFSTYYVNNLSASVNNATYYEGTSSLQVSYSLASGATGEVFRSYSTYPLDLSFFPTGLSLMVNGNANAPTFRFMLYEDNDMDGDPFESGEEIFEYVDAGTLSQAGWHELNMPFASFTKYGGGTGSLSLNRIYAWRILLENPGPTSIASTVYFDQLKFESSYSIPASVPVFPSSVFIQLWNDATCGACGTWSQAQWETTFDYMKDLCIDHVVVQYGVYGTHSWYGTSSVSGVSSNSLALQALLAAAQNRGVTVSLGLYFDGEFDASNSAASSHYQNLLQKDQQIIDDLWTLFGNNPAFTGWYIPQELHDLYWRSTTDQNLLYGWLDDVCDYAKGKSSQHRIFISPYVGPWMPADYVQSWYENLFSNVDQLDEVWLQDGSGTVANRAMGNYFLKDHDIDAPLYGNAVKNACANYSRQFVSNVELFSDPAPRVPASINRIEEQLKIAGAFASQLSAFGWMFLDPELNSNNQTLFNEYQILRNCQLTNLENPTLFSTDRQLLRMLDVHGRELKPSSSAFPGVYIKIFSDGSVEKVLRMD